MNQKSFQEPPQDPALQSGPDDISTGTGDGTETSGVPSGCGSRQCGQRKSPYPLTLIPIPGVLPPSRLLQVLDGGDGWGIEIAPRSWRESGVPIVPEESPPEDPGMGK